ncbi:cutinase family protein [Nocardia niigatensis]
MRPLIALCIAAATTATSALTLVPAHADDNTATTCAPLHLLVANSLDESHDNADPNADGGFGFQIVGAALNQVNKDGQQPVISRAYLPYGRPISNNLFATSSDQAVVTTGTAKARSMLATEIQQCPAQKIFLVGHGQGAQIMSSLARDIGAGKGPISADQLAGAAVFGDPSRSTGAPIFGSGAAAPEAVPGATASSVTTVQLASTTPASGGGPAAPTASSASSTSTGYGAVAGRVASWCLHGDLSCDIPADAALAKVVAGIAAQGKVDASDPIGTITSIGSALAQSVITTAATVVTNDVNVQDGTLNVNSSAPTVLDTLVDSANPNHTQDALGQGIKALAKIAGMGLSAIISIGKQVLTATNITEIAAAGLADPVAALATLGEKVLSAAVQLISPTTVSNAVTLVFNELQSGITNNTGLAEMALDTQYWQSSQVHTSGYSQTPVGAAGEPATTLTVHWITAAAADITTAAAATTTSATTSTPGPLLGAPTEPVVPAATILSGQTGAPTPTSAAPTAVSAAPTTATTPTSVPAAVTPTP